MLILDLGLLLVGILLVAFLLAPSVRAGTANPTLAAALVAGLIGFAPVLFAATGVVTWDLPLVVFAAILLFILGFVGGRGMAASMLGSRRD